MKRPLLILTAVFAMILAAPAHAQEPKPKGSPSGGPGGLGGSSQESPEMKALLESFHLTPEQRAKYDAAKAETSKQMRTIHEGKVSGKMPQDEVLKQALASHKAFNAAVKEILTPEQYAQWEPLREADHHKIAQAHKERDDAKANTATPKPQP